MGHMYDKWERRDAMIETTIEENQTDNIPLKPVAYDVDGKPLYAGPVEVVNEQARPQVVHMSRAYEPVEPTLSPEAKRRHDESAKRYPSLNLSEHEYIISDVRRHPIGLWGSIIITTLLVSLSFVLMIDYEYVAELFGLSSQSYSVVALIGTLLAALSLIGGYLAIWVYSSNRFFLTNESVIQEIQNGIFSRKEQIVSLMNIEDASFSQRGPLQVLLDYGSIRLSTEGEESTYRFDYVLNPKRQIELLNNAVEAFKNGRPIQISSED